MFQIWPFLKRRHIFIAIMLILLAGFAYAAGSIASKAEKGVSKQAVIQLLIEQVREYRDSHRDAELNVSPIVQPLLLGADRDLIVSQLEESGFRLHSDGKPDQEGNRIYAVRALQEAPILLHDELKLWLSFENGKIISAGGSVVFLAP